ncbi:MAG: four helix bundle protein [Patescibacteria group bacterium]|nr:four helix bundle protein [Patescibacteria group bacterium]
MPKKDRYSLGLKSENLTMEILEKLFDANAKSGEKRMEILSEIDLKLKILQTIIRICWEVKAFDERKYIRLQEPLQEIGKMLGGWIKSTKKVKI